MWCEVETSEVFVVLGNLDDGVAINGTVENFSQGGFRCKWYKSLLDKEYLKLKHYIL
jgi:hypothetical protein